MLADLLIELDERSSLGGLRRDIERRFLIAEQLVDHRAAGIRILEIQLTVLVSVPR